MFGEVTSSQLVIAVVVGIPALVVAVVVLWSLPHRRVRTVATVASAVAVVLIGVALWAVFRPATEQAAAGPTVSISPESAGPSPSGPSPTIPPPPTSQPGAACSPSGNTVTEVAQGLAFEQGCLAAKAQTAFTIDFDNKDSGVPHNIHIFTEDPSANPGAQSLFMGALVTGPNTTSYQVNPLPAGTYYFHCDVHPTTMHGTFVVG